jgi:hypothetical protein
LFDAGLGFFEKATRFAFCHSRFIVEVANFPLKSSWRGPDKELPDVEGVKLKLARCAALMHFDLHLPCRAVEIKGQEDRVQACRSG